MEFEGFKIEWNGAGLFAIKPVGKGSVPKELRGLFTHRALAMAEITRFKTAGKVKKDDKKHSDS